MYTKYLLPFFWLLGFAPVLAQPGETFVKSYDPNPQNMYVFDKGINIWSVGNYLYIINGYINPENKRSCQVFKIDANTREIVKQIQLESPQGDIAVSERGGYFLSADGSVLLTGEWRDYLATRTRTFIAKLGPDLEVEWVNFYPALSAFHVFGDAISETWNGDILLYLIEGEANVPNNPWVIGNGVVRILKTDSLGQPIFNKIVADTFNLSVGYGHLGRTEAGDFILSSQVLGYNYHPVHGTQFYNAIVHKLDSNAEPIWSRMLNYNKYNLTEPIATALPDGGGAVMWSRDTFSTDPEIASELIELHRLNSDGQTMWTHEWNQLAIRFAYRIITAANGDILGCGAYSKDGSKGKTWLFRATEAGEILWERHYSDSIQRPWSPQLEMLDLCEMNDGRIAATGIVFDTNAVGSLNANLGLLVLDANGCLLPDCNGLIQYITGTSAPAVSSPQMLQLNCTPNPTADFVSVKLPTALVEGQKKQWLCVYDAKGTLAGRFDWLETDAEKRIDVRAWPPGTYQLVFWLDRRPVFSGKLMVHR